MYNVVFKIVVEPGKNYNISKYRSNTFVNYLRKKLKGYQLCDDTIALIKDDLYISDENNIEEYNKIVDEFKSFADKEYSKISKYCNTKVYCHMGIYRKSDFIKNKKEKWTVYMYHKDNNKMPDYNTILKYYLEIKEYDPSTKNIKSSLVSYNDIYYYNPKYTFTDVFNCNIQTVYFGRDEIINGYTPKYKVGDFVEYNGQVALLRVAPERIDKYGDKYIDLNCQIDYLYEGKYYAWICDKNLRESELKPYTGEVPEFMKLLQEAVLEKNGYNIIIGTNDDFVDSLLRNRNVITEFNDFKDELIELFKIKNRGEWIECMM